MIRFKNVMKGIMNTKAKKLLISFLVLFFVILFSALFWIFQNESFLNTTYVNLEIMIEKGDSPKKIYKTIFKDLQTPVGFKTYMVRIKRFGKEIKYGYYSSANVSLAGFLNNIENGVESTVKVTIPEGYNVYEISTALERMGVEDKNSIINAAFDPEIVKKITGENYASMEGFLFPGTYFFPKGCGAQKIFKTMYQEFRKNLPADFKKKASRLGLTEYEALTLASIVQKETYAESEAPIVASVFLNRLKTNMRLQADPTIIYGIFREFDGNIRRADINDSSNIYNTYKHWGLTPTPISNPSTVPLNAVINPAETNYLYFVAGKHGVHFFSETYEQHVENVNKYIRNR